MNAVWTDLRSGCLQLARHPVVSVAAIVSLAIALGAGTLLFGITNSLLLAPVKGIPSAERMIEVGRTSQGFGFDSLSLPNFRDLQKEVGSITDLYGHSGMAINLAESNGPERISARLVSGNYFDAMELAPYVGRLLQAADDSTGNPAQVTVASYGAFQRLFGADEKRIGTSITLNGFELVFVGVTPPGFDHPGLGQKTDFFLPLGLAAAVGRIPASELTHRGARWLLAGGRLAEDATLTRVNAELATLGSRLQAAWPRMNREIGYTAAPMRALPPPARMPVGIFIGLLFALIGVVLLVATINVASLLLARGESRRREFAMRYVLGARRSRLLRQMLLETASLVGLAALVGVLLAVLGRRVLVAADFAAPVPLELDLSFSTWVAMFVAGAMVLTTLLAGLVPALRTTRLAPASVLASTGASVAGGRSRFRAWLTGGQVFFSLVLLVMTGLFMNAVQRASYVDPGYRVEDIFIAGLDMRTTEYDEEQRADLVDRYVAALGDEPTFDSVAAAAVVPLSFSRMGFGGFVLDNGDLLDTDVNLVAGDFFSTMDIPVRGRVFDPSDTAGSERVAVVNETLARRLEPNGQVLGRTYSYGGSTSNQPLRIVGVTPGGRYSRLSETERPFMYMPHGQQPQKDIYLFIRTGMDQAAVAERINAIHGSIAPRLLPPRIQSLSASAEIGLLPQKIAGSLAGVMGLLGAVLTAIGLYGMLSQVVASHTREIGVRQALGASPRQIRRRMIWIGARPVLWGTVLGLVVAAMLAALLDGFLFGVKGADMVAFAGAITVLAAISLAAVGPPAARAALISPSKALRDE